MDNILEEVTIPDIMLMEAFNISNDKFATEFKELDIAISKARTIVIVKHIGPDADAIGSAGALGVAIKSKYMGKQVIHYDNKDHSVIDALGKDDLIVYVDVADMPRTGVNINTGPNMRNYRVARIDHHDSKDNKIISDITIEDLGAGSACELVTLFLDAQGYEISKTMASILFRGIAADTGIMRYNLSITLLTAIGILKEKGLDHSSVYDNMLMKSPKYAKAKAFINSSYEITPKGVAYYIVDDLTAKRHGFDRGEAASMVYELGDIRGTRIWVAGNDVGHKIKCRVRSRNIDISNVARMFHGGGHPYASGCSVRNRAEFLKLIETLEKLIK